MHEYPITQQIIKIVSDTCSSHHATRVKKVTLVVGDMSGFIGESIQMYFDICSAETPAAGARIDIRTVKPKLRCSECGELFERKPFLFDCPSCKGKGVPSEVGKEFYIESIEVE